MCLQLGLLVSAEGTDFLFRKIFFRFFRYTNGIRNKAKTKRKTGEYHEKRIQNS